MENEETRVCKKCGVEQKITQFDKTGWEIDHIIPISVLNFSSPEHEDFKKCWNLSNLRPLWRIDNRHKYNKLNESFQPSLAL